MGSIRREVDRYWVGRIVVSALVVWLYFSGCVRPAYLVHRGNAEFGKVDSTVGGWQALTEGWLVVPFLVPWTANLWLVAGGACLAFGRYRAATLCGVAAVLSALLMAAVKVPSLLDGYWLWVGSMATLVVGAGLLWLLACVGGRMGWGSGRSYMPAEPTAAPDRGRLPVSPRHEGQLGGPGG